MKKVTAGACLIALTLTACAKSPDKISADYVSPTVYSSKNCGEIVSERNAIATRVNKLADDQQSKATSDAVATGVAIVLFWPAAFLLATGDDHENELASTKGHYEALTQAGIKQGCFSV
ncbi:hypothetical protein [Oceanomicrobium pacificus]|uniref:Lipoprotein n=1 Tax=Oceanomicrobium pacificus TaxID=2692916 RepID=A0A6B0TUM0_9RHOB|nr:hypothetical protein [Oceanomicrobium pacificus]MXU65475.1 hypothetical protein [Oceanomicrobium pacificus]